MKVYNTLSRKKEIFKPIGKEVKMYSCGPTVYSYATIGNLRAYVFADILRRVFEYNGWKVKQVINVTDVGHLTSDSDQGDDKIELASKKEGKKAGQIAKFYFKKFQDDLNKIRIQEPWKWVWASEHVKEQINLIKVLERRGYTYKTNDGIYFDSSKFKNYGKLARLEIKKLKAGKRVDIRDKRNKTDFALWKFSEKRRQQEWDSPWGVGFPGWHIECSAMSMKYLGKSFDVHTGGEDHIPVHHTNEIAQSEAATGKRFVKYWMHNAFLVNNEGKKVSKSTGGLYTLSELVDLGYKPEHFRYLMLLTHYRKQLRFTLENLDAAKNAYEKIARKVEELREDNRKGVYRKIYEKDFLKAVNDDLGISEALAIFWKLLDDFDFDPGKKLELLQKFDEVLGLGVKDMKKTKIRVPGNVKELLNRRERLRKEKKFAEADILRKRIEELGFLVEDLAGESILRKI